MGTLEHCNRDPAGVRLRGGQVTRPERVVEATPVFRPGLLLIITRDLLRFAGGAR